MNVFGAFLFLAGFLLGAQHSSAQATSTPPLTAVDNIDLRRYAGKWYEIARYPNRFQRNCQSDTTAIYTLRDDGKVQVVNACREKNGKVRTARGTAKVVDKKTNAKLKVTFFWPFYGDYWVIGLSPEYQYAIVGEPSRKYLWILNRNPAWRKRHIRQFCARLKRWDSSLENCRRLTNPHREAEATESTFGRLHARWRRVNAISLHDLLIL
jgi:apolipoprotein D and lipocalin family protein